MLDMILYVLGSVLLIKIVIFFFGFCRVLTRHLLPCQDLKAKYGKQCWGGMKSWAVITGGTDGIGKGFCEVLAEKGFNVCIISRNAQKIEAVIKQLMKINRTNEYKAIIADFTQCQKDPQFFRRIKSSLQGLNVGILVNNVGISDITHFQQQSEQRIVDILNVNCFPQALITRFMVETMLSRKERSAIVNLSSYSAIQPLPYLSIYAGTKGYNDVFSQSLKWEYIDQIDIMSATVMEVISSQVKKTKTFRIVTAKDCALGCLKDLGYAERSFGSINHWLIHFSCQMLPTFLVEKFALSEASKTLDWYSKKQ